MMQNPGGLEAVASETQTGFPRLTNITKITRFIGKSPLDLARELVVILTKISVAANQTFLSHISFFMKKRILRVKTSLGTVSEQFSHKKKVSKPKSQKSSQINTPTMFLTHWFFSCVFKKMKCVKGTSG